VGETQHRPRARNVTRRFLEFARRAFGDGRIEPHQSSGAGFVDVVAAIVLASAALLTTFASYQAALWDGQQAAHYTVAGELRTEASHQALAAGQVQGVDLMAFSAWLRAHAGGEEGLRDFYRARFRPEFRALFEAWLATDPANNPNAPPTPFAMPNYTIEEHEQAIALERQAHAEFEAGQTANRLGDSFVLATVILANALFFGGISQVTRSLRTRKILLGAAMVFCILGLIRIATLPLAQGA
jgi:hypothetical protein